MTDVVAWTDGGCRGNPGGPGGWGVVLVHRRTGATLLRRGGEPDTTNNRMEMKAAIMALQAVKGEATVEIRSDSRYLVDMVTTWMVAWERAGWRKKDKQPVLNLDLVLELHALTRRPGITFTWVRGHAGDPGNEAADRLANLAMDDVTAGRGDIVEIRDAKPPFPWSPSG